MASQMMNVFRRQFSTSITRRSASAAHGPAAEDAAGMNYETYDFINGVIYHYCNIY